MIRMTLVSLLSHFVAFIALLFVSWFQPIAKIKRPVRPRVNVKLLARTPPPVTPAKTRRVIRTTPKPKTPRPKKTIARPKKKTPTPTKTRRRKTPTPTRTRKPRTPRPRTPTPKRTQKPTRRTPRVTKRPSRPPVVTPDRAQPVAFEKSPLLDYAYYRLMAQMKISSNFTAPRHLRAKGISCLMRFTILRDGRIVNIQMIKSTGDAILDGYALRALEITATLPPLPDILKVDHVQQSVLFDYTPY